MQAVFAMLLFYRLATDAVVVLHMADVLVVVLGLPAIWWDRDLVGYCAEARVGAERLVAGRASGDDRDRRR